MPTYDYECDACGHAWELFQPITADPVLKCPKCGKKKARRLFGTGAALMFKGSGFYETDYRSESYKKSAEKEKSSVETTSESSEKKETNSKAESKAETTDSSSKKGSTPKPSKSERRKKSKD